MGPSSFLPSLSCRAHAPPPSLHAVAGALFVGLGCLLQVSSAAACSINPFSIHAQHLAGAELPRGGGISFQMTCFEEWCPAPFGNGKWPEALVTRVGESDLIEGELSSLRIRPGQADEPVVGSAEWLLLWKPSQDFEPGSYLVTLRWADLHVDAWHELPAIAFEVTDEALAAPNATPRIESDYHGLRPLDTEEVEGGTRVCCGTSDLCWGEACANTRYVERPRMLVVTSSSNGPGQGHQYAYRYHYVDADGCDRITQWHRFDRISDTYLPFSGQMSRYCATLQARALAAGDAGELVELGEVCIDDDLGTLRPKPKDFYSIPVYTEEDDAACAESRAEFRAAWCRDNESDCTGDSAQEHEACNEYATICDVLGGDPGTRDVDITTRADATVKRSRDCSVSSGGEALSGLVWVILALCAFVRRPRRTLRK